MEAKYRKYRTQSKGVFCARWTYQTLCCYLHKMKCAECSNWVVCEKYEKMKYTQTNPYGIRAVKYAMLVTYAKLGKPKGE